MIRKHFILILILIFNLNIANANNNEIYIAAKINEKLITNHDISREIEYLKILNPQLKQLEDIKNFQIAKNSLINEIIKKDELKKYFKFDTKMNVIDKIYQDFYKNLGFKNQEQFEKILLNRNTYKTDEIKSKMKIEFFWNRIILKKYSDQIKINENKLVKKLKNNQQFKTKYLLSEIFFNKDKDLDLDLKINKIKKSIQEVGFNNTASLYSNSQSANIGGKIGWVEDKSLSEKIIEELKIIKIGEHTNVIKIGNNYLILKIEDKKISEVKINEEMMLKKMIEFEKNKQLNQFSNIFFNKIKVNYSINEK